MARAVQPIQSLRLPEGLLDPSAYLHPVGQITVVSTHISWVILTGPFAYKIKKPVDLGFLDYTTLAKRRRFCQAEVRLNRRLAPDMYLEVVPITFDRGRPKLGGVGPPVEYAVKMVQLPEERLLDRLVRADAIGSTEVSALGRLIAGFHRQAALGRPGEGAFRTLWRNTQENFQQIESYIGRTISQRSLFRLKNYSEYFIEHHKGFLLRRTQDGCIRDGHGDLRTSNVFCADKLYVFDCIEFNRRFRVADTALDIAYLAMDFDWLGRSDLASECLASYQDVMQDPGLYEMLPFYKAYRAIVRGKVDSFRLDQADTTPQERVEAGARAREFFALAERYADTGRPCLAVIAGLSGTGKSTLARAIADQTGWPYASSDVVRKNLAGLSLETRARVVNETGIYSPEWTRRTYQAMFKSAGESLARRRSFILDGTFAQRSLRRAAGELARRFSADLWIIECLCDEGTVSRRLAEKLELGKGTSDADWDLYQQQALRFEPIDPSESEGRLLRIDTGSQTAEKAQLVLSTIGFSVAT